MKLSHLILSPVVLTALTAAGNEQPDSTAKSARRTRGDGQQPRLVTIDE